MSKSARILHLTWRFMRRIRPYRRTLIFTILIALCASAAKAGQVALVKPVLNGLSKENADPDWGFLKLIAAVALALSAAQFVFGYLQDRFTNFLTKRVVADLRNDITEHLSYLPLRFHHDRKSGDVISRVTNDINVMEPAANFFFDDAIVHPFMILCALTVVIYANWLLALGVIIVVPLYLIPITLIGRRLRRARKKSLERLGDMTQTMMQTFSGIKVVKAFGMEAEQVREFKETNESYFKKLMAAVRRKALSENLAHIFIGFGIIVMLVGGGFMMANKSMSAGDMAIFAIGAAMMNTSIMAAPMAKDRKSTRLNSSH